MIRCIRHRGLRRLYEQDDRRGLDPRLVERIRTILARLDRAEQPRDMDLPGLRLHPLKGDRAGYWSVTVSANWRIVFRFESGEATDLDLVDYH